jgi:segregation and condensation protein A
MFALSEEYRVQLDVFTGPLDLLLYLIRRDELDIQDIPITHITEQYLAYLRLLEQLDPNVVGDFLVMAATLVELKSRSLLPSPPIELDDDVDDPRGALVRQLLEYKAVKDAARALGSAADERRLRFVRVPAETPPELQGVELEEVEVWDLLTAFDKVLSAVGAGPRTHDIRYDDRPIAEYRAYICETLARESPIAFHALFFDSENRAEIIGLFLALLELLRCQRVRAEQDRLHGVIYLFWMRRADVPEEDSPEAEPAQKPRRPRLAPAADAPDDDPAAPSTVEPHRELEHEQAE